jgi:anti-anti-sigma regulatory factor
MNSDSGIRTDLVDAHLWVVSTPGEWDLSDLDRIKAAFDAVFDQGSTLLADLSDTTFIDSAVIGLLVATQQRAAESDADCFAVVAPPGGRPRRILDMTTGRALSLFDDLPSALEHLRQ